MKIFIVLLIMSLTVAAQATTKCSNTVVKVKAPAIDQILKQIDQVSSKIKSFSAAFKQTDLDPVFDEKEESSGNFKLVRKTLKGSKEPLFLIRFDYLKPDASVVIINGSKIILYNDTMIKPQTATMVDNIKLQALLAGFLSPQTLQENYKVELASEDKNGVVINLIPKTDVAKSSFKSLKISFNKKDWLPTSIIQNKISGESITTEFTASKINQEIKAEIFGIESLVKSKK